MFSHGRLPPLVAVVVLSWNSREDTLACLESLGSLRYRRLITIVVDNGSIDGSFEAIRARFPGVDAMQTGVNLGYAGGNNVGLRRALDLGAEYVLLLNNDTVVASDALDKLVTVGEAYPESAALGRLDLLHARQAEAMVRQCALE